MVLSVAFYITFIGTLIASWLTKFSFIYCITFFILWCVGTVYYFFRWSAKTVDLPYIHKSLFGLLFTALTWPYTILWYGDPVKYDKKYGKTM
jgi:hypothetical protein